MERQAERPLSFYQRFLRITFRTFRCSCARARTSHTYNPSPAHTYELTHAYVYVYTHIHAYSRVLFPFCLPLVSVDLLFSILLRPRRRSPSASLFLFLSLFPSLSRSLTPSFHRLRRLLSSLLYVCAYISRVCGYTCVRVRLVSIVARGFMSRDSTLPWREGGFVRG